MAKNNRHWLTAEEIADYIEHYAGDVTLSEYVLIGDLCSRGGFEDWYNGYGQMRALYDGRKFEDLTGKEQLAVCYEFEEYLNRD